MSYNITVPFSSNDFFYKLEKDATYTNDNCSIKDINSDHVNNYLGSNKDDFYGNLFSNNINNIRNNKCDLDNDPYKCNLCYNKAYGTYLTSGSDQKDSAIVRSNDNKDKYYQEAKTTTHLCLGIVVIIYLIIYL